MKQPGKTASKRRRTSVLSRLKNQLESGVKFCKESQTEIPLSEKDIKRINKEITSLTTFLI